VTDAITLTVPHARPYYGVVRLVVGGLAARLDLSYEVLEDIQIAVETLIANEAYAAAGEVTVELRADEEAIEVLIGPLDARKLAPELAGDQDARAGLGLRRLLTAVVEGVELEHRAEGEWVRLRKAIPQTSLGTPA
jgi:anti-sigma regulatory factor (Ser/Thr protein kinase)